MTTISAYGLIKAFYGDKTTKRSGVRLMNHIDEGIKILNAISASPNAISAFCLHPMFQEDKDFLANYHLINKLEPEVVALTIEYRNIANRSLSNMVKSYWIGQGPHNDHEEIMLERPIKLSPIHEVNQMLIADKVQNRKDFELHHKGKHERSVQLDYYFRKWLEKLEVSEERYKELVELI